MKTVGLRYYICSSFCVLVCLDYAQPPEFQLSAILTPALILSCVTYTTANRHIQLLLHTV